MSGLLIANADLGVGDRVDVRARGGRIVEIGSGLDTQRGEGRIDAGGGALLPGLRDHHIHLMALAAARDSVLCGPPQIRSRSELAERLHGAAATKGGPGSWLRGVGYHESVAGWLDRHDLDRILPEHPVRIQHRGGALWILNSMALDALGVESGAWPEGAERDANGQPTGRLHRLDDWLRDRLPASPVPDLRALGTELAAYGVTGLCDATAHNGAAELAVLEAAAGSGALPQRLLVMGGAELPAARQPHVARHHHKLMLDEGHLPDPSDLAETVAAAHSAGRGVAFHCVTRSELVVALSALEQAGARPEDRIEHASVAPPELVELIVARRVRVVTQPGFLYERGDAYLQDVEERDQPWLYRGRGFLDAGIPLAGSTDAPFGGADPWAAMRAAVHRCSASGAALSPDEGLTPEEALALFTSPLEAPGDAPAHITPGAAADMCLLDRPWQRARETLDADSVRTTIIAGEVVGGL